MESKCQFRSKRGGVCQEKVLPYSQWCHREYHYPSKKKYKEIVQQIRENWKDKTFSPNLFVRLNVPEDGWCFYYSFGRSILKIMEDILGKIDPSERESYLQESKDPIFVFFRQDRFRHHFVEKKISDLTFTKEMASAIHTVASLWILDHLDEKHEQTGELIKDLLLESHDIDSIEEYKKGVENINNLSLISLTTDSSISYSNWGSVCEQYALAKHFKVNTIIFSPSRLSKDKKEFKPFIAKTIRKNVRYQSISQCFGLKCSTELDNFLHMAEEGIEECQLFWHSLPESLYKQTINELQRTVFQLLFIRKDSDGDDLSHYNSLFLEPYFFSKKLN